MGNSDRVKFLTMLCIAMIVVIIYSAFTAAATYNFEPTEVYETTQNRFNITVNNYLGDYEVTSLKSTSSLLEISSIADYLGWKENFSDTFAQWYDGSLGTNVLLALFQFDARAKKVNANQTEIVTIDVVDENGLSHKTDLEFKVVNDETAPILSNAQPEDEFIKEGETRDVSINAEDPETGILEVSFVWKLCAEVNASEQILNNNNSLFFGDVDFSNYVNEDKICYSFFAENNGGETAVQDGTLTVDGLPPEVFLESPNNNQLINAEAKFVYRTIDNLAEVLYCEFYVDNSIISSLETQNNVSTEIDAIDADEGEHQWSIVCRDQAGWETTSESRTYILDKTAPTIELVTPENNSIISDSSEITFEISDNNEVGEVKYVFEGTTINASESFSLTGENWPEGQNEITVIARDVAGNVLEETFSFIIDRTAPTVELISPENQSDVHVRFEFKVNDNYDATPECDLIVDNELKLSENMTEDDVAVFAEILSVGDYNWTVVCRDDAGNEGNTGTKELTVIDITGPDMEFNSAGIYFRGNEIILNMTITDPSGVDDVDATIVTPSGETIEVFLLEKDGYYVQEFVTDTDFSIGTYTLDVFAKDDLGHSSRYNNGTFEVTYRYEINLNDAEALEDEFANITGIVRFDNGTVIENANIFLEIEPNQSKVLISNMYGVFITQVMKSERGNYVMTASVNAPNGFEFSDSAKLTITAEETDSDGDDGSSGEDTTSSTSPSWDCDEWGYCVDGIKSRECFQGSASKTDVRTCTVELTDKFDVSKQSSRIEENLKDVKDNLNHTHSEILPEEKSNGLLGNAFGFLANVKGMSLFISLLFIMVLFGILFVTGLGSDEELTPKKSIKKDIFGGDYFDKRRK